MFSKISKCAFALFIGFAALLAGGPVHAAPTSLRTLAAQNLRLASIAYRIGTATADNCPDPQMMTGLLLHDLSNYDPGDRWAVSRAFQLQSGFGVIRIVPGSAADRAGLRIDDEIVGVNGLSVEDPSAVNQPRKSYGRVDAFINALQFVLHRGPAQLVVRRNGSLMRTRLTGALGCGGETALVNSNRSNAWSDGRRVVVTTGMMRLAHNDDELAFVIAHEMAHNMLGHAQASSRSIFGLGSGEKRQELAADYDAVWLMTAAGYRAEGSISFLRTIRRRFWLNLSLDHPSFGSRLRTVAAAANSASSWARANRPVPVNSGAASQLTQTIASSVATGPSSAAAPPAGNESCVSSTQRSTSLRSRQQERKQFRPAFAVNDAVDDVGAEAPLERDHRLLLIGYVVAEALERKQEAGVGPVRVDQVAGRAGQRQPPFGQRSPREQLARVLLARRGDVGMADDIAAPNSVPVLDVGHERDQRGDLLVGERAIAELVPGIDDLDADARRIDVAHPRASAICRRARRASTRPRADRPSRPRR